MKPLRLTLTAAALLAAGCSDKKDPAAAAKPGGAPPAPVTLAPVQQKDMPLDVRTFGNVEPIATVGIKAQVSGELIDVSFAEGQEVNKGDLLFTIQPRLFATQLAQAQANLERDKALALAAAQNLKRQEELDAKGSGVKDDLEKARAQAASTAATVKADEALVLIAETQLNYTTIESPITGRTGAIRLRPGNLIRNTDDVPLTTVVQLDPIHVAFSLPEQNLDAIRAGMQDKEKPLPVTVRDPRDGRMLGEGRLTFIANTVDSTTGTVALKAEFANKDRLLWPGAFVDVSLRLATEPGVLVVPSSAITMSQQGPRVLIVKDDMTTESRAVTVIRTAGSESIIRDTPAPEPSAAARHDGLEPAAPRQAIGPGTKVVAGGQSRVLPGGKVVPVPSAGQPAPPAAAAPAGSGEKPAPAPAPAGTPAGKSTASRSAAPRGTPVGGAGEIDFMGPIGPVEPALQEPLTPRVMAHYPPGSGSIPAGYDAPPRRGLHSTPPGMTSIPAGYDTPPRRGRHSTPPGIASVPAGYDTPPRRGLHSTPPGMTSVPAGYEQHTRRVAISYPPGSDLEPAGSEPPTRRVAATFPQGITPSPATA